MKKHKDYRTHKFKRVIARKVIPASISLLLLAIANFLLLTHDLNVGGFTGLAMSLERLGYELEFSWLNYTMALIALNAIPFIIAAKNRKWGFFAASLSMTLLFGISLDLFPEYQLSYLFPEHHHDVLLGASLIAGSVLAGIGFGIICRIEASTGGSMIAKLIIKLTKTKLSEGIIMTIMDAAVIVIWASITRTSILLSMLAMILSNVALEVAIYWGRWEEHNLFKPSA